MTTRQTSATGTPTQTGSNMPSGGRPALTMKELTTRLVEVPTSVVTPPNTAAYDSGMSSFEAG
jgi:hypothetical protein